MGKGDKRIPAQVSRDKVNQNWDMAFEKKPVFFQIETLGELKVGYHGKHKGVDFEVIDISDDEVTVCVDGDSATSAKAEDIGAYALPRSEYVALIQVSGILNSIHDIEISFLSFGSVIRAVKAVTIMDVHEFPGDAKFLVEWLIRNKDRKG